MNLIERTAVPARECRVVSVTAGQLVSIVDLEGGQVGDVFAFATEDHVEFLSASHTRTSVNRLFPHIGESFLTNRRRPILSLVSDTSPGRHDMLIAACDPARYSILGAGDHPSCAENLRAAMAVRDLELVDVPQPINVFMDVRVDPAGDLSWLPASTKPGDAVTFAALMDCHVAVSACPQDLNAINGSGPTSLAIDLFTSTQPVQERS